MSLEASDLSIYDPYAHADRMRVERAACLDIPTAALEAGVVADAIRVCRDLTALAHHRLERPHAPVPRPSRDDEPLPLFGSLDP